MKQNFVTQAEVEAFVTPLVSEQKWAISVTELENGAGYTVQWVEIKNYVAFDGQTFPDEVWITQLGEMKCIQDLTEDHAKNVLRMMIRRAREQNIMMMEIQKSILETVQLMQGGQVESEDPSTAMADLPRVLH